MSYRNLEIWKLARDVAVETHRMTLGHLPKFELYEVGSQIRRSSKSIRGNIEEGYGRRRYKAEYIKHLTYAQASCEKLQTLGKKLNLFVQSIERSESTGPENR